MAIRKGSSYKDRPIRAKTVSSRAFEHALDFELMVLDRMKALGIKKSELAKAMGISRSGLSNLLNSQPNMTLETMTRFEAALDTTLVFSLMPAEEYKFIFDVSQETNEERIGLNEWDEFGSENGNGRSAKVSFCLTAFSQFDDAPSKANKPTSNARVKTAEGNVAA